MTSPLGKVTKLIDNDGTDQMFRAVVVEETTGVVVRRDGSNTDEGPYPKLLGVTISAGNEVIVGRVGSGYVVLGVLQRAYVPDSGAKVLVTEASDVFPDAVIVGDTPSGDVVGTWDDLKVALTWAQSQSSGATTMVTASTYYDANGCVLALPPGVWLILCNIRLSGPSMSVNGVRLRDAADNTLWVPNIISGTFGQNVNFSFAAILTLTDDPTTTVKPSATSANNGDSFTSATLTAVKIA